MQVDPVDGDLPARGRQQPQQDVHQRGLAAASGPDHPHRLARADLEVHVDQRVGLGAGIAIAHPFGDQRLVEGQRLGRLRGRVGLAGERGEVVVDVIDGGADELQLVQRPSDALQLGHQPGGGVAEQPQQRQRLGHPALGEGGHPHEGHDEDHQAALDDHARHLAGGLAQILGASELAAVAAVGVDEGRLASQHADIAHPMQALLQRLQVVLNHGLGGPAQPLDPRVHHAQHPHVSGANAATANRVASGEDATSTMSTPTTIAPLPITFAPATSPSATKRQTLSKALRTNSEEFRCRWNS